MTHRRWLPLWTAVLVPVGALALAGCATQSVKTSADEPAAAAQEEAKPAAAAEPAPPAAPVANAASPKRATSSARRAPRKAVASAPAPSTTAMSAPTAGTGGGRTGRLLVLAILVPAGVAAAWMALHALSGARPPPPKPGGRSPPGSA